ncbi:MAG: PQB biosynthetic 3-oxoacyl-(acyl-carrier-protein) synthase III [candidate division WS6 bacterium OLB20]|uniref:hydroxymethylglutaryl-CoA reductase (NADPH) n=1 Tax=candidate division WS6 bacterium OLB20 TaxID=1617426 RepID=A0A136M111_9BACT|nr:MAG: PQB biosynthetic 3-oxoacyl-(acyl-carrier-protein) synthase III [candidate division WS6 bacterium OLB20]
MAQDDLLQQLRDGTLKLHALEEHTDAVTAMQVRRQYIAELTQVSPDSFGHVSFEPEKLRNRNIENLIGSVDLPLGIAGPLTVRGDAADGTYYIPMATTEGTLVASTSRGAKALRLSGGVSAVSEYKGMTRAPLLRVPGVGRGQEIIAWIKENFSLLSDAAAQTSSHIKLLDMTAHQLGRELWLRMSFDTDEAMGMNMATIASQAIADHITKENPDVTLVAISGNLCVDKKPSAINTLMGRGYQVQAEAVIPASVVADVLNTTPDAIAAVNIGKVWHGGAIAGTAGAFNAHFANIVAAVYAATGQDLAHIVDAAQGYITMEADGDSLYVALTLPSVPAGTVGGGTWLPDQAAARKLMTTDTEGKEASSAVKQSAIFVEVLAAAILAGDLSLHAAIAAGQLSAAHKKIRSGQTHMKVPANTGIITYGAAIPRRRIKTSEIARVWGKEPESIAQGLGVLEKTVPAADEDAASLAVQAAQSAVANADGLPAIGAIYTGSESHPYTVKSTSAIVGEALGIEHSYTAADTEFACKAGTAGLQAVLGLTGSGMIEAGLAIGSDTAQSRPGDALEYSAGAAAAAFVVGTQNVIADILWTASFTSDTPDFWRREHEMYPSHGGRFTGEPAYFRHVTSAVKLILSESDMNIDDFDHIVFHMPNARFPQKVAKDLGVSSSQLAAGFVVPELGNSYSACSLVGLASVLDQAGPDQHILLCSYGSGAGSDAFILKTTAGIKEFENTHSVRTQIDTKQYVDYTGYITSAGKLHS